MKIYIKSSFNANSLKWDRGENEGIVATADSGNRCYAVMVIWLDFVDGEEHHDEPYLAFVAEASKDEMMEAMDYDEYSDWIRDLVDDGMSEYDAVYQYSEDYFNNEVSDANIIEDIGWFPTREEAEKAAMDYLGW